MSQFPPQLALCGVCVHARPSIPAPTPATGFSDAAESSPSQARAALLRQRVRHKLSIAQRRNSSPRCPVQHARGVPRSVCAASRHLSSPPVVEHPRHRPAYNRHACHAVTVGHGHAHNAAASWRMVPVVSAHKCVCLAECCWGQCQAHRVGT